MIIMGIISQNNRSIYFFDYFESFSNDDSSEESDSKPHLCWDGFSWRSCICEFPNKIDHQVRHVDDDT